MALQGLAYFDGIESIVSGTFTLSHGITTSYANLEIAPQSNFVASLGTLQFAFGGISLAFPGCRVDKMSVRLNASGQVVSLCIWDRRWRWQYNTISGYFNQVLFEGTPNAVTATNLRKTAQELAVILLDNLGESGYDVSGVPNGLYPKVDWDFTSTAKALDDLCSSVGCRVVLRLNNTVQLAPSGFGADLPIGGRMETSSAANPPVVPDEIAIVTGKIRYQMDLQLVPVGQDTDGSIKPIDDLSYRPFGGWINHNPLTFSSITNKINGKPVVDNALNVPNSPRDLALKTVWRWYSIFMTDAETIGVPGYGAIKAPEQILPLDTVQCQTRNVGGKELPKPAQVFGQFGLDTGAFRNTAADTEYKKPFNINTERGIVEFNEPIYKFIPKFPFGRGFGPADLFLRTSFNLRDNKTFNWVRFFKRTPVPGATGGNGIRSIVHDEIEVKYFNQYLNGSIIGVGNNLSSELLAQLNYYYLAALQEYQVKFPQEALYAGILPISPDGAIQQVTWQVGLSGATTRASRNTEHSVTVPTYEQRRFNAAMRFQDFRQSAASQNAANNARPQGPLPVNG